MQCSVCQISSKARKNSVWWSCWDALENAGCRIVSVYSWLQEHWPPVGFLKRKITPIRMHTRAEWKTKTWRASLFVWAEQKQTRLAYNSYGRPRLWRCTPFHGVWCLVVELLRLSRSTVTQVNQSRLVLSKLYGRLLMETCEIAHREWLKNHIQEKTDLS